MTQAVEHTFESAYARLQEIHTLVSTPESINLDAMIALQKEAKELHDFLQTRLFTATSEHADITGA